MNCTIPSIHKTIKKITYLFVPPNETAKMKATIATLVLFVTMGLSAKTTSLCRDIGNKVIEDNGVCSTAGGAPLGKGVS